MVETSSLKNLMQASPGLQTLPPEELKQLIDSVDTLPEPNQLQILQAMENEKSEIARIETEYEEKKLKILEDYKAEIREEQATMATNLRTQMEAKEREKEVVILDGLLNQLDQM